MSNQIINLQAYTRRTLSYDDDFPTMKMGLENVSTSSIELSIARYRGVIKKEVTEEVYALTSTMAIKHQAAMSRRTGKVL